MKLNIRLAKKSDARSIYRLYLGEKFLEGNTGVDYNLANIRDYISRPKSKMLLAELSGKAVGFIFFELYTDYAYLHTMAVHPQHRGKGIGKKLLSAAEEYIARSGIKILEGMTNYSNKTMQKFLEKIAYTKGNKFQYYTKIL